MKDTEKTILIVGGVAVGAFILYTLVQRQQQQTPASTQPYSTGVSSGSTLDDVLSAASGLFAGGTAGSVLSGLTSAFSNTGSSNEPGLLDDTDDDSNEPGLLDDDDDDDDDYGD
jgi:hypothetical protein